MPGACPWSREELAGPVLEVAPALLGTLVVHGPVVVRLTEVEAYAGSDDPGSHAYRGPTRRTAVMFGPAGHLYCYFSYGMHWAANVVTGTDGTASAVLLRAGEVVAGAGTARERRERGRRTPVPDRDLARGPGNLGRALALGRDQDGLDLCAPAAQVSLHHPDPGHPRGTVRTGPRVGVSGDGGSGDRFPWRFWLDDEPTVSAYRAGSRR
ncbi:DNA-3-methyladenine glycosylase II [Serinicoccus hydrothermalis]|uniref:Putative 3-methyladenine DNA glycosylase n=1 Tax=Serinicoccus hydrothermalis TaxID=1758689 RepID=A0A1B1N812_9MICO|nr:DNA-3-methyladenine glycosylase [Serinicoccus hydrothermalis]ANS77554.1 DNA-3-methyladenine glycosylase II [Serinicoccus hydrothermalis]